MPDREMRWFRTKFKNRQVGGEVTVYVRGVDKSHAFARMVGNSTVGMTFMLSFDEDADVETLDHNAVMWIEIDAPPKNAYTQANTYVI